MTIPAGSVYLEKQDLKRLARHGALGLAAAVIIVLYSLSLPNFYRSEARILPVDAKSPGGMGGLATAAAAFGVSVPGPEGPEGNYVDIINSRTLKAALLQTRFAFDMRYSLLGPARHFEGTLAQHLGGDPGSDRTLRKVGALISATRDAKSKVLVISAETRSPGLSQQLVEHVQALLEQFVMTRTRTRGGAKAAFAAARLAEARGEMDQAEDAFRAFLERNRNYQISPDPAIRLRGLRLEAELKLRQQLVSTIALTREQALMEEKNDIPILNLMDAASLPTDKTRPTRAVMVFWTFVLVSAGSWALANRGWIRHKLFDPGD